MVPPTAGPKPAPSPAATASPPPKPPATAPTPTPPPKPQAPPPVQPKPAPLPPPQPQQPPVVAQPEEQQPQAGTDSPISAAMSPTGVIGGGVGAAAGRGIANYATDQEVRKRILSRAVDPFVPPEDDDYGKNFTQKQIQQRWINREAGQDDTEGQAKVRSLAGVPLTKAQYERIGAESGVDVNNPHNAKAPGTRSIGGRNLNRALPLITGAGGALGLARGLQAAEGNPAVQGGLEAGLGAGTGLAAGKALAGNDVPANMRRRGDRLTNAAMMGGLGLGGGVLGWMHGSQNE